MRSSRPSGMFGFSIVWLGQVVSLLGTGMTQFALTIWAWQVTVQATALALVGFFGYFPRIVFTPLAGALADRWNRKTLMIASDLAAGLATVAVFILYKTQALQIWHLFAAAAFSGAFGSFQFPAYQASISLMLPKEQYTRANTMLGLAHSISSVFAPMAAGALLAFIGIDGIMTIDIVTFSFAVGTLLIVAIPQPAAHHIEEAKRRNLLSDCAFGFRYVFANRSLTGLLYQRGVHPDFGLGPYGMTLTIPERDRTMAHSLLLIPWLDFMQTDPTAKRVCMCRWCGIPFYATRSDATICSATCRSNRRHAQARAAQ